MATSTPWGKADNSEILERGLVFYSTPSHGGYRVSLKAAKRIPLPYRAKALCYGGGLWFEEDCAWALIAESFRPHFDDRLDLAVKTLKDYYPHAYKAVTGKDVTLEESYVLREEHANRVNFNRFAVSSARGDWAQGCPKGCVLVFCRKRSTDETAEFILPKEDYDALGHWGAVDETKYPRLV